MQKKNFRLGFAVLGLVVFLAGVVGAADKVELKLRLQKGETYKFRTSTDMVINQSNAGRTMETKQKIEIDQSQYVDDIDSQGNFNLKMTFETFRMKSEGEGFSVEYDSSKSTDTTSRNINPLASLVGQSFTVKMSPLGKIIEINDFDEIIGKLIDKTGLSEEKIKEKEDALKKYLSEESVKQMMGNSMVYPDYPVAVGDTWNGKIVTTSVAPMIVETTHRLKELKDGKALIELKSIISPNLDSHPMETDGKTISLLLSGEISGTTEVDEKTGWIVHITSNQKISGEVKIEDTARKTGLSIPMSIVSTMTGEKY